MKSSVILLSSLTLAAHAGAQTYRLTSLGTLGGQTTSAGYGVNDAGTVVGTSGIRAFRWTQAGGMISLFDSPTATTVVARAINAVGTAVGSGVSCGKGIGNTSRSFSALLWTGKGVPIAIFTTSSIQPSTEGINDAGVAVGYRATGGANTELAFRWTSADGMTTLGTLPGAYTSQALAVNEGGRIVGVSGSQPFLWTPNSPNGATGKMVGIGKLPGATSSTARAINDAGVVVGDSGGLAFRYDSAGGMVSLGTSGGTSSAYGIDDAGDVVGTSGGRAFIDTAKDGMQNLDSLLDASGAGWTLTAAYGMSDSGLITGVGMFNGQQRAFLLTPVPEPATMMALGIGTAALLRQRRR